MMFAIYLDIFLADYKCIHIFRILFIYRLSWFAFAERMTSFKTADARLSKNRFTTVAVFLFNFINNSLRYDQPCSSGFTKTVLPVLGNNSEDVIKADSFDTRKHEYIKLCVRANHRHIQIRR